MLFEKFADDYARLRPGYPSDLIISLTDSLRVNRSSRILDLACGTGNLGHALESHLKADVVSLDRSSILLRHNRSTAKINAVAEALPLKNEIFGAVIVGQAFHWFAFNLSLNEIARTLKTNGGFAIIWYRRARPIDGHRLKMDNLVRRFNPDYKPGFMDYNWPQIIGECGRYKRIESFETRCTLEYTIGDYLKLQRTKSYVGDAMTNENVNIWSEQAAHILADEFPDGRVREKMEYCYVSALKA